uniref:Uncharacterized protein n=1 Tax=Trichogramma kaykai TaxID=54128 RepID=A0ABD2XJ90_9HYME
MLSNYDDEKRQELDRLNQEKKADEDDVNFLELFFKICEENQRAIQIDARDKLGNSPLHLALIEGKQKVAELLLRKDEELVELLLRRGADPNGTDEDGSTLLHVLSRRNSDIDLMKMFFEICDELHKSVEVDARDNSGRTPLHLALTYGDEKLVEVLLRRDADPSLATNEGSTPLHLICSRKDPERVESFFEICDKLRKSVDVNARGRWFRTPLSLALMPGGEKLVELLLKRGACPNTADDYGLTVLHLICRREYDFEMAKLLFGIADEKNQLVQVDRKDKWGRTPLQLAVANLHVEMIAILLDRGADPSSFVFPSANEFERYLEGDSLRRNRDIEFELCMPLILESLEKRGYQLDRRGAFAIIQILAYMSVHAEKYWNLVDYPAIEESSSADVERVKKYPPRRPRPYSRTKRRRLHIQDDMIRDFWIVDAPPNLYSEEWINTVPCSRTNLYETTVTKRIRLPTQDAMIRDPWIDYGPPNLYSEELINPVPWNFYGPPHLCTRSEDNPEPWNFYEPPAMTSRFVYRPEPSRLESPEAWIPTSPPRHWLHEPESADYEEYRAIVAELDAKRHPHEAPRWRGFLLRWAARSVVVLTRRRLPESCCERIAERLTNVDLLNVCVAERFHEWRADRRTRDRYAFRRMSLSRRKYWQGRRDLEDIRYPPPWRPEAYKRYYGNKKFRFDKIKPFDTDISDDFWQGVV